MWLVLGTTVIVASVFAGRSDGPGWSPGSPWGVVPCLWGDGECRLPGDRLGFFAEFGELSQFAFVRETWASLRAPNTGVFIGLLIAGEATAGILVLCGGRWMRAGLVLLLAFHVGLLFFGSVAVAVCRTDARRAHPAAARGAPTPPRPCATTPRCSPGVDPHRRRPLRERRARHPAVDGQPR